MTFEPLTPEQREALANLLGEDAKPAEIGLVLSLGESVRDAREHDHTTQREDWFCMNLTSFMGIRMAPMLRRLIDAEAEVERLRTERDRYRTAWGRARTRAISTGGAADRYAARAQDAQEALQHMLFTVIASQLARRASAEEIAQLRTERHSTNESLSDAAERMRADRDRIAELETTPLAWAEQLDAKSLDNFLVSLAAAAEHEPMDGALVRVNEVIRSFREAVLGIGPDRLTRTFAPTQALPEDQEAGE
ncbi:hypothetical protein [Streptomyces brasiliscabiei]|uniref:hypothetical protein n=1 Tax=Streptomyces brasiliscabiei TaxID=2736302 RepID=UPI001C12682B|nr:hypothetical protein [Streptomyces brasiliscabiei]